MNFWWLDNTARLAGELKAVDAVVEEGWFSLTRWGVFDELLGAEGVITVHGHAYDVRLLYPDQYPLVPAWVIPQDPKASWSSHQYGKGGVLCLELRPDTWHPGATGGTCCAAPTTCWRSRTLWAAAMAMRPPADMSGVSRPTHGTASLS